MHYCFVRDSYFGFKVLSLLISEVSSSASGKILEQGLYFLIPKKVFFFRIAVILFQSQLSVDLKQYRPKIRLFRFKWSSLIRVYTVYHSVGIFWTHSF